jgi:hypothetical protein
MFLILKSGMACIYKYNVGVTTMEIEMMQLPINQQVKSYYFSQVSKNVEKR